MLGSGKSPASGSSEERKAMEPSRRLGKESCTLKKKLKTSTVSSSVSDDILLRIMELLSEREMRLNFFLYVLQLKCSDFFFNPFLSCVVYAKLLISSHKSISIFCLQHNIDVFVFPNRGRDYR